METSPNQLDQLLQRLTALQDQQAAINAEYFKLKAAILALKAKEEAPEAETLPEAQAAPPVVRLAEPAHIPPPPPLPELEEAPIKKDLERFIGENLSNKIGAFITVLGVGIGVKYAIDNNLIGPITRILLGYGVGIAMFVVSQNLKAKYRDLSAVILGGALCIAYFTSFAAHVYYQLIPQAATFILMLGITALTVWQALKYDRQVIAIGGLVGAYFIPFLLSDGSDRPVFLFSYICLINCGILYISFLRNWKLMHYLSFIISWWMLLAWYLDGNPRGAIVLTFSSLFFAIFTAMYLAEQFILKNKHDNWDSAYLILNGLFFFFSGFFPAKDMEGAYMESLFMLFSIVLYIGMSLAFFRKSGQERPFGLLSRMAMSAVLIWAFDAFDNPELTIFWALCLVLFFAVGRLYRLAAYEKFVLPLGWLLLVDLLFFVTPHYYLHGEYLNAADFSSLWNEHSLAFIAGILAFSAVYVIHLRYPNKDENGLEAVEKQMPGFSSVLLIGITALVYLYFFNEISHFFDTKYRASYDAATGKYFEDWLSFKVVWLINFTMIFVTALNGIALWTKMQDWKREFLAALSLMVAFIFLALGLYELGYLKNCYMLPQDPLYPRGIGHLIIRYVSIGFLGVLLFSLQHLVRRSPEKMEDFAQSLDLIFHGIALWVVGSELVHWLELNGLGDRSYKIALSILFGCWSVLLIVLGIRRNKKSYRIAAIVLFAATLFKLFLYDLEHLSTISKTVVLISLGTLLLIISYLYNKFKEQMGD